MSEWCLRLPWVTYCVCGLFTQNKHKQEIQKFNEIGDSRYIYQNKLDKAYFQHHKQSITNKQYCVIKHLIFYRKYDWYKHFYKKISGSGVKNKNIWNKNWLNNHTNQIF